MQDKRENLTVFPLLLSKKKERESERCGGKVREVRIEGGKRRAGSFMAAVMQKCKHFATLQKTMTPRGEEGARFCCTAA